MAAWPGVLLGCLPSSSTAITDKPEISTGKRHEEPYSDEEDAAEDNALEDHEIFHRLAHEMDNFLNQAKTQDGWSEKLGSIATGMFMSSGLINSMSRGSKTVYDKLKSTKFEDITTTAGDIFAVMGKAHWAASGLLVVAAVIHNIQKLKRVDKECIELLVSVNAVARSLGRFTRLPHIPEEMKSTVNRAKNVISTSAASCLSIIYSPRYRKFIFSSTNEAQISSCKRDLESVQRDLGFQLIFADYIERHEPGVGSQRGPKQKKKEAAIEPDRASDSQQGVSHSNELETQSGEQAIMERPSGNMDGASGRGMLGARRITKRMRMSNLRI